jgi:predicted metalloprotease with PDZ domain
VGMMNRRILARVCVALIFAVTAGVAQASAAGPAAPALGTIKLWVDATQAPQKILHAKETIPVHAGALTLYYPEWIPGEHAPDGPVANLAGLKFSAGGKEIPWRRDLVDMFAFHLDIPAGADSLDVQLDFLLSAPATGFSAGASATASLDLLSWNQVLLYPKGYTVDAITFESSLRLPDGWKFATSLPVASQDGGEIHFSAVSLDMLVDSPVISGRFLRVIDLSPGQTPPHEIDIAADSAAAVAMPPELQLHLRNLVTEAGALFGSRHYRDYHFLLTLSDDVAHFGLEHHESDDSRLPERSLIDETLRLDGAGLLPHEYVHSWNGKYRRPADLATPDFQQPMKDDLLWVYEGLTEYLGNVLTARSGLYTQQEYREHLADIASTYEYQPGRTWRPLQDTADAASLLYFAGGDWENWRRGTDYYDEGELIWLEVDTKIRQLTQNSKSIDDFCKLFEGGPGGQPDLKTYTFDDVVNGLNAVAPNDWRGLLTERLTSLSPHAPLGGIVNGGWKLVYNEAPNEIREAGEEAYSHLNLRDSVGLSVNEDGAIGDVIHGGPSYNAGLGPGMRIVAVNGRQFSPAAIGEAIEAAKSSSEPINLLVANGVYMKSYAVDYHGGLRFPHLERVESQPDLLSDIAKPHATQ